MTRLFMLKDEEILTDKTRRLTVKNQMPGSATPDMLVTASHIVDYKLGNGLFAI